MTFYHFIKKCLVINKNISKNIYKNIIGTYKRASNIIDQELKSKKEKNFRSTRIFFI